MKRSTVVAALSFTVSGLILVNVSSASILEATGMYSGNVYQIWSERGIAWDAANLEATGLPPINGQPGHLATITSAAEDNFIEALRNTVNVTPEELWIGGFQPLGSPEPGGNWQWVNGEGPIPGTNPPPGGSPYANWLPLNGGEPNDSPDGAVTPDEEQFLGIAWAGNFGWNDEGALANIGGYVVEFDGAAIPEPATFIVWGLLGLCGIGVLRRSRR